MSTFLLRELLCLNIIIWVGCFFSLFLLLLFLSLLLLLFCCCCFCCYFWRYCSCWCCCCCPCCCCCCMCFWCSWCCRCFVNVFVCVCTRNRACLPASVRVYWGLIIFAIFAVLENDLDILICSCCQNLLFTCDCSTEVWQRRIYRNIIWDRWHQ